MSQIYPDELAELDTLLIELEKQLAQAYTAVRYYGLVGFNAKEIRKTKYNPFFGTLQSYALTNAVITTYNLFDKDDNNPIISIPSILKYILDKNFPLKYELNYDLIDLLGVKLSKHKIITVRYLITKINVVRPTQKNNEALNEIYIVRNKRLAHRCSLDLEDNYLLPSDYDFENLLNWADNFFEFIRCIYFPNIHRTGIAQQFRDRHAMSLKNTIRELLGDVSDLYTAD